MSGRIAARLGEVGKRRMGLGAHVGEPGRRIERSDGQLFLGASEPVAQHIAERAAGADDDVGAGQRRIADFVGLGARLQRQNCFRTVSGFAIVGGSKGGRTEVGACGCLSAVAPCPLMSSPFGETQGFCVGCRRISVGRCRDVSRGAGRLLISGSKVRALVRPPMKSNTSVRKPVSIFVA